MVPRVLDLDACHAARCCARPFRACLRAKAIQQRGGKAQAPVTAENRSHLMILVHELLRSKAPFHKDALVTRPVP